MMSSKRRNGTDTDLKRLQEEFEAEFSRPKVRIRLITIIADGLLRCIASACRCSYLLGYQLETLTEPVVTNSTTIIIVLIGSILIESQSLDLRQKSNLKTL